MKWLFVTFFAVSAGAATVHPLLADAQPAPVAPQPAPPTPQPAPANPQPAPAGPADTQPAQPMSPPPVAPSGPEVLTLERAIEIAMRQQPSLRQSKAQLEAAQGRVDQSRVIRNPTISLSADVAIRSQPACSTNQISRNCGALLDNPAASAGLGAQAYWRIYDFGVTQANIHAAELNAEAFAAAVNTTTFDIRTAVEVSYLEAVARRRLVQVAESTVKSEDSHLDQAKRFVAAQAKDPIEVAQATSRDANAKSVLAQAQSNEAIALANLRSAIGWVEPTNSPTVSASWPVPADVEPPALTALVETARKTRPEIVQLDKEILAADASLAAARAERRPILSATASAQWTEYLGKDASSQTDLAAGLALTWPLFDGGKSAADARVARANVANATAQRDALLISLTSQLDLSRAQIIANRANVQASTEAVAAARAQMQLADARYAQGLGSQIELADAQTAVTTAGGNLVQAEFQLASAWAQLHRATAQW
jgi:outer membrane protein